VQDKRHNTGTGRYQYQVQRWREVKTNTSRRENNDIFSANTSNKLLWRELPLRACVSKWCASLHTTVQRKHVTRKSARTHPVTPLAPPLDLDPPVVVSPSIRPSARPAVEPRVRSPVDPSVPSIVQTFPVMLSACVPATWGRVLKLDEFSQFWMFTRHRCTTLLAQSRVLAAIAASQCCQATLAESCVLATIAMSLCCHATDMEITVCT